MPNYLIESYLAGSSDAVAEACRRARSASDAIAGVRYVRTTFLPAGEMALHLFEAPSMAALRRAAGDAALDCERVVEAVESTTSLNDRMEAME
jgi:hypothetical protein